MVKRNDPSAVSTGKGSAADQAERLKAKDAPLGQLQDAQPVTEVGWVVDDTASSAIPDDPEQVMPADPLPVMVEESALPAASPLMAPADVVHSADMDGGVVRPEALTPSPQFNTVPGASAWLGYNAADTDVADATRLAPLNAPESNFALTELPSAGSIHAISVHGDTEKPEVPDRQPLSALTLTGDTSGHLREDAQQVVSGKLSSTGVSGTEHWQIDRSVGLYGHLQINEDGQWRYTLDNTSSKVQGLCAGEQVREHFVAAVTDSAGRTRFIPLTIAIDGTADQAIIRGSDAGQVTEDRNLLVSGTLTVSDVDADQAHFHSSVLSGRLGILTLDTAGHWFYQLDNGNVAVQALGAGKTATDVLTVSSMDGTTHQITITVHGSNDRALISGTHTATVTEDNLLGAQGRLSVSDVDQGEAGFVPQTLTGGYGQLQLDAQGHWSYQLDNANPSVQALGEGESATDTLTVTSLDGTPQQITIVIRGANDVAQITGSLTGSVAEDSALLAKGTLVVTDADQHQAHFNPEVVNGQYGSFSLDANGHWLYVLDNTSLAVQGLKSGEQVSDVITVTSVDGTACQLHISVTGTNDIPVLSAQAQAVKEDGVLLTGQLQAHDVDHQDILTFSASTTPAGFTLHGDGSYSFDPSHVAYQHLAAGQVQTLTIPITVTDSAGASSTRNLMISLTGTNDGSTIAGVDTGSTAEGNTQLVTGQLTIADVDDGQAHFMAQVGVAGTYGTFTLNEQGQWSYQLDNSKPALQALKTGDSVTDRFTVSGADGTMHQVSMTVTGKDDGALIAGTDSATVTEDQSVHSGQLQASGQLSITDPDAGEAHFTAQTSVAGTYGSFSIDTTGHWAYSADNSQTAIQQLKVGDSLTDRITVTSADGTSHTVTVTLQGTNDAPILQAQAQAVTEDGTLLHGQMVAADVDAGDRQIFSIANPVDGFTLNADGSYSFDPANAAYQHLAAGQTQTLSIPITVTDHAGATSTQNLTITVTGTNDGATIAGVSTGTTSEDNPQAVTGQLTVADVDDGQAHFLAQSSTAGSYGSFTLNEQGQWSYQLDNSKSAVQILRTGDSVTDSFTVTSADGTTHQVTITVTGNDDGAVIGGTDTGAVSEDQSATLSASGTLSISDPDAGQDHFTAQTNAAGRYGSFSIDVSGHWTYSADNSQAAIQQLKAGDSLIDSMTIASADGTKHTLLVAIRGTNDAPTLTAQAQAVTEDGAQLTGHMVATDVDQGDTQTYSTQNPPAGFTLNADGSYSFDPSNATYQHLNAGQTQDVVIPITVTDSAGATSTQNLTITVTGTNDGAVIGGRLANFVTEDSVVSTAGMLRAGGQLTVVDPDAGEDHFVAQTGVTGAGHYGSFSIDASGHYSYTADNTQTAIQQLKAGETLTDRFTVTTADGTQQVVTITINGAEDRPVLQAQTHAVSEDGARLTGQMLATDVDAGDTQRFSISQQVAGFTLSADGSFSFDPANAAYQHLAAGQTQDVVIPVTVTDSTGATSTQNLTISVAGANDGAVIGGVSTGIVTEDASLQSGRLQASGQLTITDIDTGEDHFISQTGVAGSSGLGHFSLDASGAWTYSADNTQTAIQQLKAGETLTDTFIVRSTDGTTHTVTVTIQGCNDAPVLAAQTQAVSEDGTLLSGHMVATDVDAGDTLTFNLANAVDGFTLNADGSYSFDPSHASYQHLAAGQTQDVVIPITVTDGSGATATQNLTIRLTGTNDAARISGTDIGGVVEDQTLSVSGQLQISDVDDGQAHFIAQTATAGSYGSLTLGEDGHWQYQLDNSKPEVQALKSTETATDTFTVHSADGSSHSITVTIQGQRDSVVIGGVDVGVVKEDVSAVTGGHLVATGESAEFVPLQQRTTLGNFAMDASGAWTYTLDNSRPGTDALKSGETVTDTVTITHTDGTTHTITITVMGTNDAPVLSAQTQAVTEDGTQLSGHMIATDVDAGDTQTFSLANTVDGFTLNADGSYSFDPSHASYQHLAAGQTQDVVIPITVTDSGGAISTQNLTLTVTGTNDGAMIAGVDTGSVSEDGVLQAAGQLSISDADAGEAAFQASPRSPGQHGVFSLAADGSWTYALNNSDTDVQALTKGQSLSDSLVVKNVDGSTHTITVSIQGRDDGAVIAGVDTGRVTEDQNVNAGQLQASGQLTLIDADTGQHQFTAQSQVAGHYGSFSIDASGAWTYTADNNQDAVQQLGRNDSLSERFRVTSADGTQHMVVVTLQGSNDVPVVLAQTRSVTEDGAMLTGQMRASDTDIHDRLQFSTTAQVAGFTLAADGSYSFDPRASAYQNLGSGAAETLRIPVTVRDQFGAQHTRDLLITVTGTNDGAIIQGKDTGDVVEDQNPVNGLLRTQGQLAVRDPDAAQSSFVAQTDVAGRYGHFSIDAAGAWTYQADNASNRVQELREGAQAMEHFVVRSLDGSTHSIRITVHGTNDVPVVTAAAQSVTEDGALLFGQLRVSDRDRGDQQLFQLDHPVAGFTLSDDGSYRFDPKDPAHQDLREGQVMRLEVPITVTDSAGAVVHHTLSITLTGRNDTAVISGVDSAVVTEDAALQNGLLQASGQLQVSDIDDGEANFTVQGAVAGSHGLGHFSINASGHWLYTADNTQTAIQQLKTGDSLVDSITVTSTDGTAHTVTVTIQGANDAPVLQAQTQAVTEDGTQLSGHMDATDVDAGDTQTFSLAKAVDGFTLNANGSYSFDPSHASYQHLAAGQTQDVIIPITVTDSAGATATQNLTIRLTGTNDAARISGTDVGRVVEDQTLSVSGQLAISDADDGQARFVAQTATAGSYGSLTIGADGQWQYQLDNSKPVVQALKSTETATDSFTVHSADGSSHNITVTIQGQRDSVVIGGVDVGVVKEDVSLVTGGHLVATGESAEFVPLQQHTTLGEFSMDAAGAWTFTLDNSRAGAQALKDGETATDSVTITHTDGTTHTVTLTVMGTNDAPVLSAQTQAIIEDGTQLTGHMAASDVDAGDTKTFSSTQSVDGFTLNADGSYSFDPSHASYQHLAAGQTQDVVIAITVTDHAGATSTQNLTITVTGSNDGAVISGTDTGTVIEDQQVSATHILSCGGKLGVTDVDAGEATFAVQHGTGANGYGSYVLGPSGIWTYSADNTQAAIQQLKAGETLTDTFTVSSTDGTTHTVTVTLQGTNDAPVLAAQTQAVTEDGAQLSGHMVATDADAGDTQTFSLANAVDGFMLNADGSYQFDPSHASYQHLTAGQTQDVVIAITVTDSAGAISTQNLTITVTGSADGAVISGVDVGTVTEDTAVITGNLQASGQLTVSDVDTGEAHFTAQTDIAGSSGFGHFSVDTAGAWTYTADNTQTAIQQLKSGESLTDTLSVASADGTTHTITVTVQGTNDAPVLAAQTQAVIEDGTLLSGHMAATDADAGDTQTFSLANAVDGFTLNADGSYSFDPSHASYQHLAAGQTQDVVIPITVTDSTGLSSTQNLSITVTGSNDGPQVTHGTAATAADLGAINEDAPRVFTEAELLQAVGASAVDDGTSVHIVAGSLASAHGTFTGDAAHGYTFTPAANFSGQDVDLQFNVSDGSDIQQAHARLDITPVADKPVGPLVSTTFDDVQLSGQFADPALLGWKTDSTFGVEQTTEDVFGGTGKNQVLELVSKGASINSPNIYRELDTQTGQWLHVSFDASRRENWDVARIEVLWEGKVIDAFTPGTAGYEMHHHEYDLQATGPQSRIEFRVVGDDADKRAIIDNIQIGLPTQVGEVNQALHLDMGQAFQLADTDGSETLSYLIKGLPPGFTLTDGTHSVTIASVGQVVDTKGWSQDALALRAPQDYQGQLEIQVSARAEETANHQTATSDEQSLRLSFDRLTAVEDTPQTFSASRLLQLAGIRAGLGEVLTLDDVQVNPAFGHFSHNADGSWTFTPEANVSAHQVPLTLTVHGGAQPISSTLHLDITPVADTPLLDLPADGQLTAIHTDFDSTLLHGQFADPTPLGWHTDGPQGSEVARQDVFGGSGGDHALELISEGAGAVNSPNLYRVLDVASGQMVRFGFDVSPRNSWAVPLVEVLWEGKVIDSFTPSGTGFGLQHHDYDLLATAGQPRLEIRVVGAQSDMRAIFDNLDVGVSPVAARFSPVNGDAYLDLGAQFHLADTDGSETLSYVVKGLPQGFTLTDGTHSITVTTAGQAIETKGWDQAALVVKAPQDFQGQVNLQVSGVAEESGTQQTASSPELSMRLSFEQLRVYEDTPQVFTESKLLQLAGVHAPAGQAMTLADVQVDQAFGQFSQNANGSWTFTPAANVNADDVPFTLTIAGGSQPLSRPLQLSIAPVNDAPVLAAQSQTGTEDGSPITGHMVATDVDVGDTQSFSLAHPVDGFTLNADGSYSFDPSHASYQHLAAGQTQDVVIPITVTDHAGATGTQNLTFTLTGTDDGLQVVANSAAKAGDLGVVDEDAPRLFTEAELLRAVGASDVDDGNDLHIVAGSLSSTHGTFTGDAAHGFTFTPSANFSGQQVDVQFSVSDGGVNQATFARLDIRPVADVPVFEYTGETHSLAHQTDFDSTLLHGQFADPTPLGWHTDAPQGSEVARQDVFGGSGGDRALEMISSGAGKDSSANFYRVLDTVPGQELKFSFDVSPRSGWAVPLVEVLWEGKVIDSFTPSGSDFSLQRHDYQLTATGEQARLELRVVGDQSDMRAIFDKLEISDTPHLDREALVNSELQLHLPTNLHLADTDGSETLSYLIKGLPVGFTLTDGSHSITVTAADQVIDTKGWQQDALSVQAPKDFAGTLELSVTGRSEEAGNQQTASSAALPVRLSFQPLATVEDTPLTLSESKLLALAGAVPAAGEHLSLSDVQVDPALGQFSHNADGSWTFTPAANVNADQVPFTLTVAGGSQPISSSLQLSITPVNDAPVIAAQTQAVTEDATVFNGYVLASDPDAGDTLAFSTTATVDGFTLNADGSYSFDPSHASYQHLAAGQTQAVIIPITVTDSAGAISTQNLTITLTGSNDGPLVIHGTAATAADLGAINEDAPHVFSEADLLRLVGASDVDDGARLHIVSGSLTSAHGTISGDAAHGFTFTPAANYSGQDVDLQFSVSDGTASREAFATLDITPVADAPVRDGGPSITTDFNSVDVGAGGWKLSDPTPLGWHSSEASGVEIGQERLYGGSGNNQILSLTASWSSNIYRDLATQAGQTVHVGFDLSARPGFAMTPVEVLWEGKVIDTISPTAGIFAMQHHAYDLVATGGNSRLEFRATGQGEARALFDNIQIGTPDHLTLGDQDTLLKPYLGYQLADTDGSETLSYAIHGLPVGFTLTDGTHSATVAAAGQVIETIGWNQEALALRAPHGFQGDVSIQVTARAEEGSNHQTASAADITLHLSGLPVSHAAVIGGDTAVTVTEDQQVNTQGNLEHFGQLTINDPDAGEAQFVPQNAVQAQYGHYTIDQRGFWLYEADNKLAAIQQLKTGEHLTDSFTVHSADGTAQTITVTIQGQDDAPAFVPHAGPTRSDDVYSDIGHALESMSHQNFKYLGGMILRDDVNNYPFETALVVIRNAGVALISPDGSVAKSFGSPGGSITEVPIIEMINWHDKGPGYAVVFTDAKAQEISIYAHNSGNPGMLSGHYPYTDWVLHPEQDPAHLTPVMHDVAAASGGAASQGAAVMPPAIAPLEFDSAHVLEDSGQQISGFIEVKDADAGQSSMKPQTDAATHFGRFSIDANGDWVYQLDNRRPEVQQLGDGQTLIDTITVHSEDGTAHEVNITLHGQNDGAVITGFDSGHVQVGGQAQANGQLQVSDVDVGQAGFQAGQVAGSFGSLSIEAQGHWQYQLNAGDPLLQQLLPNSSVSDHLSVHSLDGTAHTIDINVSAGSAVAQQPAAGGVDAYANILASVHAAGYQYRGLADALDRGDLGSVANLELSISGSHVEVIDSAGHLVQSFSPVGADYAATMSMRDVLLWHAQGNSIVINEDSGQDSTRMWLHNTGDAHSISVRLSDGTGFDGYADKWMFGELPLSGPDASASSSDVQDAGDLSTMHVSASSDVPPMPPEPVNDYLQFVDTSTPAASLGTHAGAISSHVHDYLAAAGVESLVQTPDDLHLPPPDVLMALQPATLLDDQSAANEHPGEPAEGLVDIDTATVDDPHQHHAGI